VEAGAVGAGTASDSIGVNVLDVALELTGTPPTYLPEAGNGAEFTATLTPASAIARIDGGP
jgi:hypothetical protein